MTVEQRATGHSWPRRHFVAAILCSSPIATQSFPPRGETLRVERKRGSSRWLLGSNETSFGYRGGTFNGHRRNRSRPRHLCTRTVPNYVCLLRFPTVLEVSIYTYIYIYTRTRSVRLDSLCVSPFTRRCARLVYVPVDVCRIVWDSRTRGAEHQQRNTMRTNIS